MVVSKAFVEEKCYAELDNYFIEQTCYSKLQDCPITLCGYEVYSKDYSISMNTPQLFSVFRR